VFLFLLEAKCSDVLKEHSASIFGVMELLQMGADVMQ
jgi:hypothetical protein